MSVTITPTPRSKVTITALTTQIVISSLKSVVKISKLGSQGIPGTAILEWNSAGW